jgi:HicB family
MTTPPVPSARPPSSRRFEALDGPAAKAFVQGADPEVGEGARTPAPSAPPPQVVEMPRAATPVAAPVPQPAPAVAPPVLPQPARKERQQPVTLRVSESLHAQLLYIAENGPRSMNQFIVDVLGPAVAAEIEKIQRRKALGLD